MVQGVVEHEVAVIALAAQGLLPVAPADVAGQAVGLGRALVGCRVAILFALVAQRSQVPLHAIT